MKSFMSFGVDGNSSNVKKTPERVKTPVRMFARPKISCSTMIPQSWYEDIFEGSKQQQSRKRRLVFDDLKRSGHEIEELELVAFLQYYGLDEGSARQVLSASAEKSSTAGCCITYPQFRKLVKKVKRELQSPKLFNLEEKGYSSSESDEFVNEDNVLSPSSLATSIKMSSNWQMNHRLDDICGEAVMCHEGPSVSISRSRSCDEGKNNEMFTAYNKTKDINSQFRSTAVSFDEEYNAIVTNNDDMPMMSSLTNSMQSFPPFHGEDGNTIEDVDMFVVEPSHNHKYKHHKHRSSPTGINYSLSKSKSRSIDLDEHNQMFIAHINKNKFCSIDAHDDDVNNQSHQRHNHAMYNHSDDLFAGSEYQSQQQSANVSNVDMVDYYRVSSSTLGPVKGSPSSASSSVMSSSPNFITSIANTIMHSNSTGNVISRSRKSSPAVLDVIQSNEKTKQPIKSNTLRLRSKSLEEYKLRILVDQSVNKDSAATATTDNIHDITKQNTRINSRRHSGNSYVSNKKYLHSNSNDSAENNNEATTNNDSLWRKTSRKFSNLLKITMKSSPKIEFEIESNNNLKVGGGLDVIFSENSEAGGKGDSYNDSNSKEGKVVIEQLN